MKIYLDEEEIPEPEENEDFFIDDINRKYTEPIKGLDCSRRSIFVKCILGHLGKDSSYWIHSFRDKLITLNPYAVSCPAKKTSIRYI